MLVLQLQSTNFVLVTGSWSFAVLDQITTVANTIGWPNYPWIPGTDIHVVVDMLVQNIEYIKYFGLLSHKQSEHNATMKILAKYPLSTQNLHQPLLPMGISHVLSLNIFVDLFSKITGDFLSYTFGRVIVVKHILYKQTSY